MLSFFRKKKSYLHSKAGRQACSNGEHGCHQLWDGPEVRRLFQFCAGFLDQNVFNTQSWLPNWAYMGKSRSRQSLHEETRGASWLVRSCMHAERCYDWGVHKSLHAHGAMRISSWLCDIPQDVCLGIHKSLATNFRYGLVWWVFSLVHWHHLTSLWFPGYG